MAFAVATELANLVCVLCYYNYLMFTCIINSMFTYKYHLLKNTVAKTVVYFL